MNQYTGTNHGPTLTTSRCLIDRGYRGISAGLKVASLENLACALLLHVWHNTFRFHSPTVISHPTIVHAQTQARHEAKVIFVAPSHASPQMHSYLLSYSRAHNWDNFNIILDNLKGFDSYNEFESQSSSSSKDSPMLTVFSSVASFQ